MTTGVERNTGRRFPRKILFPGCLGMAAIVFLSSWLSLRSLEEGATSPAGRSLAWDRELGILEAGEAPPSVTPVPEAVVELDLPQVLSVEDAVESEKGWVILDRRAGKVHLLDSEKGLVRSLGREGPGPGEFQAPVAMALQDTTLWILNHRGTFLDRYSLTFGFLARRRLQGGGCLVGPGRRLAATGPDLLVFLRTCPALLPGPASAWLEEVSHDGTLTPLMSLALGESGSRKIHLLRQPEMAGGGGSVYLGTWDAPCLLVMDPGGEITETRCLPSFPRPTTPVEKRSELERRFRRLTSLGLFPMEIPEHLPWYDRVFFTHAGPVARRIRGLEDRDLVLLRPDGSSSASDRSFPEATYVGETTILSSRDLLQGTRIQIFPNPWR